jgi:hypothetical protein
VESVEGRGTTFRIVLPHRREADRIETPQSLDSDREGEAGVSAIIGDRHFVEEETSA